MLANVFKLSACMFLVGSSVFADSAFGIEYGGELPKGAEQTKTAGFYRVPLPPKPHSLMVGYNVLYTPETGVCLIGSYTKTFENDKYGTQAKEAYDRLGEALNKKYGPNGNKWEELKSSALWDEPDEFARSLIEGDRNHARWFEPTAGSDAEFDYVQISIGAMGSSETFISLAYENSKKRTKCDKILSEADDSSL